MYYNGEVAICSSFRINTKLGGVCSYLHPHALAWVKRAPTMVVGELAVALYIDA